MTTILCRCGVLAAAALLALLTSVPAQAATHWAVPAATTNHSQARSGGLTTTSATAHCAASTSTSINVTWTAVAHAGTYTVLSATAAAGPYTAAASGLTTTSYAATGVAGHSYWYEVQTLHNTWTTTSTAAGPVTVASGPSCTG